MISKRILVQTGLSICLAAVVVYSAEIASPSGLYVRDGILMFGGAPYRGMGINYYTCFNTLLAHPENRGFVEGFGILRKQYRIPFIRFAACPYGAQEWKLYSENPEEYFRRMDLIVREAEKQQLGLIPSLFWRIGSIGDWCNEPLGALGSPNSKTRAFYRKYAMDVVKRYKNSPSIWGWEIGNEYMLGADLPKLNYLPKPKTGSLEPRSAADKIFRTMVLDVYKDIYNTIRSIDPNRILITGDTLTRESAWNNHYKDEWGLDTRRQWLEMFAADTPECFEMVSFHLYPEHDKRFLAGEKLPIEDLVSVAVQNARERNKPVWCGEFGGAACGDGEREMVQRMFGVIRDNKIELSALWNFVPNGEFQRNADVTPSNDRAWMLSMIDEFNQSLSRPEENVFAAKPK